VEENLQDMRHGADGGRAGLKRGDNAGVWGLY
jgi:hypothetical protein